LKLGVGGVLLALTATIGASYVVPKLVNADQNLARVAKRVAAGPRSVDDANRSKVELSNAIRTYLKDNGSDKTNQLSAGLQKLLPVSTYEVHVAELPRGLRVVEVDTVLQATDFMLMKTATGSKVFDLPGFEVFDDARILNDTAGPVVALIGHTGGQPPHKPLVKTYALLPDSISDETYKLVPALKRDGSAKFAANGQDIQLEIISKAAKKGAHEEVSYGLLHWKDAKFSSDYSDKTASSVRQHFKDVQVASAPTPVADHPASPPPASAAAAPAVAVATGSSTEKIAATASPVLANAIAHARANLDRGNTQRSKPAKIVVRGLTDSNSANSLISQLPPAAVGAGTPMERGGAILSTPTPSSAAPSAGGRPPVQPSTSQRSAGSQPASASGTKSSVAVAAGDKSPKAGGRPPVQESASTSKHDKHHKSETASASGKHSLGVISCSGGATLRATAARGGTSLGGLSTGTQVEILGHDKEWCHVRTGGRDGYIYAALLDTSGKMAPNPPEPAVASSSSHKHKHHHHHEGVLVADASHDAPAHSEAATASTHSSSSNSTSSSHSHHHKHSKSSAPVEAPGMVP
jgi:hypothetical protein